MSNTCKLCVLKDEKDSAPFETFIEAILEVVSALSAKHESAVQHSKKLTEKLAWSEQSYNSLLEKYTELKGSVEGTNARQFRSQTQSIPATVEDHSAKANCFTFQQYEEQSVHFDLKLESWNRASNNDENLIACVSTEYNSVSEGGIDDGLNGSTVHSVVSMKREPREYPVSNVASQPTSTGINSYDISHSPSSPSNVANTRCSTNLVEKPSNPVSIKNHDISQEAAGDDITMSSTEYPVVSMVGFRLDENPFNNVKKEPTELLGTNASFPSIKCAFESLNSSEEDHTEADTNNTSLGAADKLDARQNQRYRRKPKGSKKVSVKSRVSAASIVNMSQTFNKVDPNDSQCSANTHLRYPCDVCGKRFMYRSTCEEHRINHTQVKPFECNVCSKSFRCNSHLIRHFRIHTKEKPYSCVVCKKSFNRSFTLKTHMLVHTGERPFSCVVCKKSFNQSSTLKTHMLVHTGERRFKCSICNKTFQRKDCLTRHEATHRR